VTSREAFPREMVLASAGTGKTHRLTSRIIGLLARRVPPEEILASTFTRNAAGEILGGVLFRIAGAALDAREARELSGQVLGDGAGIGPGAAGELLESLCGRLHRFEVGTLDSLFVRLARSFWPELDLPPGWAIADAPTAERLRSEALQDVLAEDRADVLVELVRMLSMGDSSRRVHDRLTREIDDLHRVHRELDPGAPEPWSPFRPREAPEDSEARRRALAEQLREVRLPEKADGDPDGRWVNARDRLLEELPGGDWERMLDRGLGAGAVDPEFTYHGKPPTQELRAWLDELRRAAAAELQAGYAAQARAMGRLAERYDRAFGRRQRREGAYRFEDLTHRLGQGSGVPEGREADYRLDRRVRHLLLDEFQDTSLAQWETLRPVVDRVAERPPGEAALVVVADPKQSIYGWRGADPRLLERMDRRYGLRRDRLDRSWRSSPVVLDFVDDVFRELPRNPVVESLDRGPEVARVWSRSFTGHRPAPPRSDDAGHVVVEVGPEAESRGDAPPEVLARAAERVAELHRRAPHASVGVLTRTNRAVRRLIGELRHRDLDASEEGGTSVSDVAPVAALLSLLRMADHPGDRVARYHVARTPVGEMIGYRDHADGAGARRVSREVRRRLLRDGYGDTLAEWVERLAASVDRRELRRLGQLVELAFRWADGSGLRPGDFVRYAESERVKDPSAAPVRVMTIHQAKGLEFDAVVLPELGASLTGRGGEVVLPERDPETGRVQRVFPGVKKPLRPLFPELAEAHRQHREAVLRDAFSLLYVALTRARRAVHVVLDGNDVRASSTARRFSRLLLAAFGLEDVDGAEGDVLLERGDPHWYEDLEREEPTPSTGAPRPGELRIDRARSAGRMLRHRSPSDLADGGEIRLDRRLELGTGARRRGRVVHEWLGAVRWLEEGLPEAEELRRIARRTAPGMEPGEVERLLASLSRWRSGEAIRRVLSRGEILARARRRWGSGVTGVEAANEWAFVHRVGEEVVSGRIDRLTVLREAGNVLGAEVVDYKVEARSGEAVESHAPQLRAYVRAVAGLLELDPDRVGARLVFLDPAGPGEAVEL